MLDLVALRETTRGVDVENAVDGMLMRHLINSYVFQRKANQ